MLTRVRRRPRLVGVLAALALALAPALPSGIGALAASSAPTQGYWFVAADGGIFSYGDALFSGSAAGTSLRPPTISMTATPSGKGYYLAAADGTVHAFGDALFRGSMGGKALKSPIAGITTTATGGGYWL